MAQKLALTLDGTSAEARVERGPAGMRVLLNDRWFEVELVATGHSGLYSLLIDGRSFEVFARSRPGGWDVLIGNRVFAVDTGAGGRRAARGAGGDTSGTWVLKAPMTGIINEVRVSVGDMVEAGQVLLVVESMKMNNELAAARAGRVTSVNASAGQRVDRGALLVEVE